MVINYSKFVAILFALYSFSGVWNTMNPLIEHSGLYSSILIFFILFVILMNQAVRKQHVFDRNILKIAYLQMIFCLYCVSVLYLKEITTSFPYEKVVRIFVVTSIVGLAINYHFDSRKKMDDFVIAIAVIGSILAVTGIVKVLGGIAEPGGITSFNENRIVSGRAYAMTALAFYALILNTKKKRLFLLFGFMIMIIMAIASMSKGIMVSFVFAVILREILLRKGQFKSLSLKVRKSIFAVIIIVFIVIVIITEIIPNIGIHVRERWEMAPIDPSTHIRKEIYRQSIESFLSSPIVGIGLGNFYYIPSVESIYYGRKDIQTYAHNIFLEVLSETGIIGSLIFFIPLFMMFKGVRGLLLKYDSKSKNNLAADFILMSFILYFISSFFSGDVQINRYVWLFGFLSLYYIKQHDKSYIQNDRVHNYRHINKYTP